MQIRSRSKVMFVMTLALLVFLSTVRFGYALLEEGRDLNLVDYAFQMSLEISYADTIAGSEETRANTPIDFTLFERTLRKLEDGRNRQKRMNYLDEVPPQTILERLVGYFAPIESVVVRAARAFSGSDRWRAFRQVQVDFLKSRRPPMSRNGGYGGVQPEEMTQAKFFSHPSLREFVARKCLEHIEEDIWDTSLDARCLNYRGIVATDRTRDRVVIANQEESLKEAIEAFQEAIYLDRGNPYIAENLEKLLEYAAALQLKEQEATSAGSEHGDEPSEDTDEGLNNSDNPGGGKPGQGNY